MKTSPDSQLGATAYFIAPKSLLVFPVGTSIVATAARAGRTIGGMDADSVLLPLVIALLIGLVLFGVAVAEPRSRPKSTSEWLIASGVAVANSLVFFVAAIGIDKF